jgi:hypothetical protein
MLRKAQLIGSLVFIVLEKCRGVVVECSAGKRQIRQEEWGGQPGTDEEYAREWPILS